MRACLEKTKVSVVFASFLLSLGAAVAHAEDTTPTAPQAAPQHVRAIEWQPTEQHIAVGQQIAFTKVIPVDAASNPNDFLYSVLVSSEEQPVWETVVAYQHWPLPNFYFNRPGIYSVQIDIVNKDAATVQQLPQGIWLTQYIVKEKVEANSVEGSQQG